MGDSTRVSAESRSTLPPRSSAGTISRIRLENFMCHSSLQIILGERVNFITGQNGSGKSAILTALCVAFGSRARATQRASSLKDFIKTGCSYALVHIELKNEGDEAFKPEIYGDMIIIERRITQRTISTVLKNQQGKKVATRKEDLQVLVGHFNIDVENPCVIMSQDKSREFLHSGNSKDKFKFFFKATLLQQVHDLLQSILRQLDDANAHVDELEDSIRPIIKEPDELKEKMKSMEQVEELSQEVQELKKKLAWAWVYDIDKQLKEQSVRIEKLKGRIPTCQRKIDLNLSKGEELKGNLIQKKAQIASVMEKTNEVRRMKEELEDNLSSATKETYELRGECDRRNALVEKLVKRAKLLDRQVNGIKEDSQAEQSELERDLKKLQDEVYVANIDLTRLNEEEKRIFEEMSRDIDIMEDISAEIAHNERKCQNVCSEIRELQLHQTNKVTAFGGEKVINLLQGIEKDHMRFTKPPIGPIGNHVKLVNGDMWALSLEPAIGKLLNAFIVTNHKDLLLLRSIAREAGYNRLQIVIYDFSRPRLSIPSHRLPRTNHPTVFSVVHIENDTVANVLVDMGSAERQVLVKDYDTGKSVAFDRRIPNLKEVYTLEGYRMFSRNAVQTTLPPNRHIRRRLCASFHDQITNLENEISSMQEISRQCHQRKRAAEESLQDLTGRHNSVKKRREKAEVELIFKEQLLQDVKNSYDADVESCTGSNVDELSQELYKAQDEVKEQQNLLGRYQVRLAEAETKSEELRISFENLCESTKADIDAFTEAERELMDMEDGLNKTEAGKSHYEGILNKKVLPDINKADALYQELQVNRQESSKKASIICSESEVEALGGCSGNTPEKLSAQLMRLNKRVRQENQRHSESIEDLRPLYERKKRKITRKEQTIESFREKLNACQKALDLRWNKLQRNSSLLKRQLTWRFNGHLVKKGISGYIKVSYEEKTLSVEVKMPQDASSNRVRDTRGLSGGERSFSTLCFALALHDMNEAPFRAMDEFDVFMDAVSRKISLDTLVDFAVAQGSQWIFITPHDISTVKPGERVKKQQMAAPRT